MILFVIVTRYGSGLTKTLHTSTIGILYARVLGHPASGEFRQWKFLHSSSARV